MFMEYVPDIQVHAEIKKKWQTFIQNDYLERNSFLAYDVAESKLLFV